MSSLQGMRFVFDLENLLGPMSYLRFMQLLQWKVISQVRITVFDDGLEGKDLPTGFNADVEGRLSC